MQGIPTRPPSENSNESRATKLGKNLFHGGGLYPSQESNFRVVAPCLFSPTGWVKRKLTGREVCLLKDIPEDIIKSLPSDKIEVICQDEDVIPLKIILRLIDTLVNEGVRWSKVMGYRPRIMVVMMMG
jgi:hypothetical protein